MFLGANTPHLLGSQEARPDQARWVQQSLGSTYGRIGHGRGRDRDGEGTPTSTTATGSSSSTGRRSPSPTPRRSTAPWAGATRFRASRSSRGSSTRRPVPRSCSSTATSTRSRAARGAVPRAGWPNWSLGRTSPCCSRLTSTPRSGRQSSPACSRRRPRRHVGVRPHPPHRRMGTFNNYRRPRVGARRIDAILATPDVGVRATGIDPRPTGTSWPSDHLPVQAVVADPGVARGPAIGRDRGPGRRDHTRPRDVPADEVAVRIGFAELLAGAGRSVERRKPASTRAPISASTFFQYCTPGRARRRG